MLYATTSATRLNYRVFKITDVVVVVLVVEVPVQSFTDKEARSHKLKTCYCCLFEESDTVYSSSFYNNERNNSTLNFRIRRCLVEEGVGGS